MQEQAKNFWNSTAVLVIALTASVVLLAGVGFAQSGSSVGSSGSTVAVEVTEDGEGGVKKHGEGHKDGQCDRKKGHGSEVTATEI